MLRSDRQLFCGRQTKKNASAMRSSRVPSDSLHMVAVDCVGGSGASSLVFSAIMRPKAMPTPSITASRTAHPMALFLIAFAPPRIASAPPVRKPPKIAFHGSSFFLKTVRGLPTYIGIPDNTGFMYLMPFTAQSKLLNSPPQTPKLPPRTGARAFRAVSAPMRRSPCGELLP